MTAVELLVANPHAHVAEETRSRLVVELPDFAAAPCPPKSSWRTTS